MVTLRVRLKSVIPCNAGCIEVLFLDVCHTGLTLSENHVRSSFTHSTEKSFSRLNVHHGTDDIVNWVANCILVGTYAPSRYCLHDLSDLEILVEKTSQF